jgi:hypothetical protein
MFIWLSGKDIRMTKIRGKRMKMCQNVHWICKMIVTVRILQWQETSDTEKRSVDYFFLLFLFKIISLVH